MLTLTDIDPFREKLMGPVAKFDSRSIGLHQDEKIDDIVYGLYEVTYEDMSIKSCFTRSKGRSNDYCPA
jgi:hypothetical protein